jgi:hypothetical protein
VLGRRGDRLEVLDDLGQGRLEVAALRGREVGRCSFLETVELLLDGLDERPCVVGEIRG